ncbi:MAG TPA: M56 family metallopeptidase [Allosphingosinicella sp.]|nr:M56 family metallopeptidase [Allosphingosinicella sp.]
MIFILLVEIAWKSVVTSGVALLLLALLKNRTAAERSWVAHAGLLATLLLPVAVILLPNWNIESPAILPQAMVEANVAPSLAETPSANTALSGEPAMAAAPVPEAALDRGTLSLWLYFVPAALLLLATLVAVLRLFALRRRASVLVEQTWLSALAHAQRRMGFKHGTALLVSNELASPVSWGILRPIILLNEEAVAARDEAEAIIAHELAHVARLDWAKLLIARAATALFWFNPLVWSLARQCHQLREEAADDAVLRSDVPGTDYAALLVGAARHENNAMLLAAHGVAPGRGSLKRRVMRVLDTGLSRAPARIAWTSACSVGAILISAPLSALTPVTPLPASVTGIQSSPEAPLFPMPLSLPAAEGTKPAAAAAVSAASIAPALVRDAAPEEQPQAASGPSAAALAASPPVKLAQSGRLLSPDMLVQMKIHGVTPEYVQALAAISPRYANLTPDQLVGFRIHGVTAAFIRELAELGYRELSHDQLTSMAIHGVRPSFIREMAALGYRGLSADQLTSMRIHGVSPSYVREFRDAGYRDLSASELINMRIHGVRMERPQRNRPANPPAPPLPPDDGP